jgi:hypothetical protein
VNQIQKIKKVKEIEPQKAPENFNESIINNALLEERVSEFSQSSETSVRVERI